VTSDSQPNTGVSAGLDAQRSEVADAAEFGGLRLSAHAGGFYK